jgi:hypothetical protein
MAVVRKTGMRYAAVLLLACAGAQAQAQVQLQAPPPGRPAPALEHAAAPRENAPQELAAITRLTQDYQGAIAAKNPRALSALMFSANILFATPATDAVAQHVRDSSDVTFDGIGGAGLGGFLRFIAGSPQALRQRIDNVRIVQDGVIASVDFDYDFLMDGRTVNHGMQSWQLYKTEGSWKILSAVWSSHGEAQP